MNGMKIELLKKLLSSIAGVSNSDELNKIISEYSDKLDIVNDELMEGVFNEVKKIGDELVMLRGDACDKGSRLIAARTEQERTELAEIKKIIDENLFDYHFQPIISTTDGEIYSYEALMRPKSKLCPSPYHVIKYAEIMDRLNDIEYATFLNVLNIIGNKTKDFYKRPVFINSIPSAKLDENALSNIQKLLEQYSENVVVEMTEQSEMSDDEFDAIKEMYNTLNVRTAIDDYGTGYSNVQNLLKYMPDYVKIDRSLVSDIQNNRKKRYFMREIIDFCHENGILALAEGVETSDEMRTVIQLGADLIQGYYTARPSAVVAETIPYEIRKEIKLYRQEREDGKKLRIYSAEISERVVLDRLEKEGYRCVLVGKSGDGNVTIACTPGVDTNIHIDVANDFKGSIKLDDSSLSNVKGRPCINIGENCEVQLVLNGTNHLRNGGIKVPESSKLIVTGEGELSMFIDGSGYYGIGNDGESRHGELIFERGVTIDNHAPAGVCIGSGLGGKIRILRGQFMINLNGYIGAGIGAYSADADIDLYACDITVNMALENGVAIGSVENDCHVSVHHSAVKLYISGTDVVGIGTLTGEKCDVSISESSSIFNLNSDRCSAIAALEGSTRFELSKAGMHIVSKGDNALALGGYSGDLRFVHVNSDSSIELVTKRETVNCESREKMDINGGRVRFLVNGNEILNE